MSKSLKHYMYLSNRGMYRSDAEERQHIEMSSVYLVSMLLSFTAVIIGWLALK